MSTRLISLGLLLLSVASAQAQTISPTPYEKPIKEEHQTAVTTENNKAKISCFYYKDFMAKEVDTFEKGAEKLSITPYKNKGILPKCTMENIGEIAVKEQGYFLGALDKYVFFRASDGVNRALDFFVYDGLSGRKLFQETAKNSEDGIFKTITVSDQKLKLEFRKAHNEGCSLAGKGDGCMDKIRKSINLPQAPLPNCSSLYQEEQYKSPKFSDTVWEIPSMISYDVVLNYANNKVEIKADPSTIDCWPSD